MSALFTFEDNLNLNFIELYRSRRTKFSADEVEASVQACSRTAYLKSLFNMRTSKNGFVKSKVTFWNQSFS